MSEAKVAARRSYSRLRRFLLRHLPLSAAGAFLLLVLFATAVYFVASSAAFENLVRQQLVTEIESLTGGRAEIASFHWHLLHLEAEASGVVIHGLEDPGEAPYAKIDSLRVRLSLRNLFSPKVLLRSIAVERPRLHFIVYPNGSTNQPQPRRKRSPGKPAIDTLFDLRAGQITVVQGVIDFDSRATAFDYKERYAPLNFDANDLSLQVRYLPAAHNAPAAYRIELGAADLSLARHVPQKVSPVQGHFQATIDLERTRLFLRTLRLSAHTSGKPDRALEISGSLEDFAHPRWQAKAVGDLDMRLIDPITGYSDAPEGIAHLNLAGGGGGDAYEINGSVHVEKGSYIGEGINATGLGLDAWLHADPGRLQISQIAVHLRQGGEIDGSLSLSPWLPSAAALAQQQIALDKNRPADRNTVVFEPDYLIPVNGKVIADFKDVALDTVLDMVCPPGYRRLGIDARLNGAAHAEWAGGDGRNVVVSAAFAMSPSRQAPAGETPATGALDATYRHRDGGVDLRKLELHTPASELDAHGQLGAYPITSPTGLSVDFHSHNLAEFDTALRTLDYKRNGKSGTAALPIALTGQADLHAAWTGSLARPHLAGNLKATQIALELPSAASQSAPPQFVHLDEIDAEGIYSPAQIVLHRAQLVRGKTRLALNGTLDAAPQRLPEFDGNSVVHARLEADGLSVADIQPFVTTVGNQKLPVEGAFDARLQADGPLREPTVAGWVAMGSGSLFGEPVERLRAEGALDGQTIKVNSATVGVAGGNLAASGSYDVANKRFQVAAHGSNVEISRIDALRNSGLDLAGKLGFSVTVAGTANDPSIEGRATLGSLSLHKQPLGELEATAHTTNHTLNYNATARLESANATLRGQTELHGGYVTHAQLDFSRLNIGPLLKLGNVKAFSGDSAMEGTVALEGPLAHFDQLRGEARLRQLAMTLSGVKLESEGGLHATLAGGRIALDPLHVTGEGTDLRAQGGLSLEGARQLDLAASGSVNMKLAETVDPDLTASGITTFQLEAHGPMQQPNLQGSVEFQNAAISFGDLPNGLSQLRGRLEFNQNRLEIKTLTAVSGGGQINMGGFLAYQHGIYADLSATGTGVRIRYPQGVTSLADAKLQLQGTQNNLLLSGNVTITRFGTSSDFDLSSFVAQSASSGQIAAPEATSNHVRLDVHIGSSPQLNFQNAFAKLAGNVDLRVRGTLASPSLLGRVAVTDGSAMIAGTRYELQRGDITFTNPVRIEPTIDLSASARVEDYDILLGLHGTPQKMAVIYRSDPPLPEADVVSLLALGRTASQQRLYTQQQERAVANPTDALLGGALNATMSSRVQKLFGAGSVKVDPNYLGAFGNSTSRVTVEEQVGRAVVLTYATDVNTTSQQLLQAEVAINRHISLVMARDESGVFSMVIKATRRYR
jgi:translocation and assembly module TamB